MSDEPKCPTCGVGIDSHEATHCLDIWVGDAVLKWERVHTVVKTSKEFGELDAIPTSRLKPSQSDDDARVVIEDKFDGFRWFHPRNGAEMGSVSLFNSYGYKTTESYGFGKTLALAVCRAAIRWACQ